MTVGARAARAAWLGWWNLMRRYHRFEVRGIERVLAPGAKLIVGYHGRAQAHDLIMMQMLVHERTGRMPRAIMHATAEKLPILKWLVEGGEFLIGDDARLGEAVARGETIIVTPGGTREACRSYREKYRVAWGDRLGYLRLAVRYRLPIVPVAAGGVDDTYLGLNDGYAWGKRARVPGQLPLWLGVGPLGLWPLSPPFPVKIVQHVGEAIDPSLGGDGSDRERLRALHGRVVGAVQGLLDGARGAA